MVNRIFSSNRAKIEVTAYAFALFVLAAAAPGIATAGRQLPKGPATVTATDGLYLRHGPSRTAEPIVVMPYQSRLRVLGAARNGYYRVRYEGTRGFAHGDWLTPVESKARPAVAKTDLYLRRGPSTSHGWITVIDEGSRVLVTGPARNGFLPVKYGKRAGWAAARYLATPNGGSVRARVRAVLTRAGLGDQWTMAERIVSCESSWNPRAENPHGPMRGLWQINWAVHAPKFAGLDWRNPAHNTRVAIKIYREAGNSWSPWSYCASTGRFGVTAG